MMKKVYSFILISVLLLASCRQNPDSTETSLAQAEFEKQERQLQQNQRLENVPVDTTATTLATRFPAPEGYERIALDENSFGYYLRHFKLKDFDAKVYAYDGSLIQNEGDYISVLDIDVGTRDLQQCADAVMRLRAEYLYGQKRYEDIHFNFLSDGKPRYYKKYCNGDYTYPSFRKYMDYIFSYANTTSLSAELIPKKASEIAPGFVFIEAGRPIGHAVIVMDVVENPGNGERLFLLAQSFMPAQSIHLLVNFNDPDISPWYRNNYGESIITPNWDFSAEMLKAFKDE